MAVSRVSALVMIIGVFHGSLGATLHDSGHMMRHERKESSERALEMDAHAEFIAATTITTTHATRNSKNETTDEGSSSHDFCDYDYTFGNQNSNDCKADRSTADVSDLTANECAYARAESGAHSPHHGYLIPQEWDDVHPEGCFAAPCNDPVNGGDREWCYYMNLDGATPAHPSGYPVCRRWKYLYGKSVPNVAVDGTGMCPDDTEYKVIADEDDCRKAANCLGNCAGSHFDIGTHSATNHAHYPPGCFLGKHLEHDEQQMRDRSCVYWNDPAEAGAPTAPVGSPICVVKAQDKVTGLGSADDADANANGGNAAHATNHTPVAQSSGSAR